MIPSLDITLTPNCYKVAFSYHPLLVACCKRIPTARYQAEFKHWEVQIEDAQYLRIMAQWAQDRNLVRQVRWMKDEEPVESYEPLPMPELTIPHNIHYPNL